VSKRNKKPLRKEQVEKLVFEKTGFVKIFELATGEECEADHTLEADQYIICNFDSNVLKRIRKFSKQLLQMRGIKSIDTIDENDYEVKTRLAKWKKAQKKKTKKPIRIDIERQKIGSIIDSIKREHQPEYLTAIFQTFIWAIMYDDLFTVENGSVDCKLEVEVPEDYWVDEVVDEELDKLFRDYVPNKVVYDETSPFEIMIAISSSMMKQYDNLNEPLGDLFHKMFATMRILDGDYQFDAAGFLYDTLDELLSDRDEDKDDSQ
jgi:hypothetical protein